MADDRMVQYNEKRRTSPVAYTMSPRDQELVAFIAGVHGCSRSEAVRIAVRFYAVQISKLSTVFESEGA